jgi:hypothetical protein
LPLGNQKKEPVPGGTPGCPDALTFLTAPGYPGSTVGALREEVIFLMLLIEQKKLTLLIFPPLEEKRKIQRPTFKICILV